MKTVLDFLGSVKFTLVVLLGLSLVAVGGTIWPFEQGQVQRFDLYYQSIWFRILLGLLAINLLVCTWRNWARQFGDKKRLIASLHKAAPESSRSYVLAGCDPAQLEARLRKLGYRLDLSDGAVLARRGMIRAWALPILHLSLLVIMLGAFLAELGFVGTINMYVNHQSDTYFDWDHQQDRPLDFTFRLDHFEPQYYPIDVRFATFTKDSREMLQEYTATEGDTVQLSEELAVELLRFYPEEEHLVLGVIRKGIFLGEYHGLGGGRSYPNSIDPGYDIVPTAFRDPLLKQLHSEVSIIENGQVVRQGAIQVNHPMVHRGVAIYQTVFSRDASGFWVCGFQLSKDPGEPLVWFGSVVLILALTVIVVLRYQAVGAVFDKQTCQLLPLAGFRGSAGRERFADLTRALDEGSPTG